MAEEAKRFEELHKKEACLKRAALVLSVAEGDLPKTIERFQKDLAASKN